MKALLILAPERFRDEEYFQTKDELEKAKIGVVTASKNPGTIGGMLGGKAAAGIGFRDVDINAYNAIVFIGGGGSAAYFNDSQALSIAKKAAESGKVIAAICIAPVILANAGLLKGKKATVSAGEEDSLRAKGAIYTGEALTVDGSIITACGPKASKDFGKAIAHALGR